MKVININTREVLFDNDPEQFAVYIVVVPHTEDSVMGLSSIASNIEEYIVLDSEEEAIAEAMDLAKR